MRQNPQRGSQVTASSVKCLFYEIGDAQGKAIRYAPLFYVEARVDFNDVRTGYRSMVSLNKALEIHPIGLDFSLSADMVRDVDPCKLSPSIPDFTPPGKLPDFVDVEFASQLETLFIRYLLNSFSAKLYRNFALDLYSSAGESLADFTSRCMDLLGGARRRDLDALHEVFNRRLGQIEQKYLNSHHRESFEGVKTTSHGKAVFSGYLERIADLFLQSKPVSNHEMDGSRRPRSSLEMEEQLLSLESEAQHAIAKLWDIYLEKARSIDEYIIHPNLKDIHLVRSCILWMPTGAD